MNIFQNLPNDLIMNIIKEADGGRYTHKKKFNSCLNNIVDSYQEALQRTGEVLDNLEDYGIEYEEVWEYIYKEVRCQYVIFQININYHIELGLD